MFLIPFVEFKRITTYLIFEKMDGNKIEFDKDLYDNTSASYVKWISMIQPVVRLFF